MKIGVYTFHAHHNVGAMLQAFATVKVLQGFGAEPELVNLYPYSLEESNHHRFKIHTLKDIIRFIYLKLHPQVRMMDRRFDLFHQQMPLSKRYFTVEEYISDPLTYDIHLVGSDQVWNLQKGYEYSRFYFLDYLPASSKKISFASSFGTTDIVQDVDKVRKALSCFENLSAREDKAVEFIKHITGKHCTKILDPSLLLNQKEWDLVIPSTPIIKGKYIFFYGVNKDKNTWNIIKTVQKYIGVPVVGFPGPIRPSYNFDKYIVDGGPLEFVNLIKHATFVITSSFHGLAFSVNYNKNFILVKYGERMERLESLVRSLDLDSHYVNSPAEVNLFLNNYDNNNVTHEKLDIERKKSMDFLKKICTN